MKKSNRVFFLCGLPRSGSTLLGSLLNQNPQVYVSPTSPLYSLLVNTNEHLNLLDIQYTFNSNEIGNKLYKSIVDAFYPENRTYPIIFDKHRGWPKHIDSIRQYIDKEPRLICPTRPIAEIITSYITLADKDPDNFIDAHLKKTGQDINNEARAYLLWTEYLKVPYENMLIGLKMYRDNILLVEYDDLVYYPEKTLQDVYEFCGMDYFKHEFDNVENTCAEAKDEAWGLKDLHTIRNKVSKKSIDPLSVLPNVAIEYFSQFDLERLWTSR